MTRAIHRLHEACPESQHPRRCDAYWKRLKAQWPEAVAPQVAEFTALAPQVGQALQADVSTSQIDNQRLDAVAAQIHQIYKEAQP